MTIRRSALIALPAAALAGAACTGSASARLELNNQTVTPSARSVGTGGTASALADGTSLRLKLIAVYLATDVDPVTMNNTGDNSMIWLNPECTDGISDCNVAGFTDPPGPRIQQYFDLARSTDDVNAELNSQDLPIEPGTYRYARVEMCKALDGQNMATVPTLMWQGPGMTEEQPFTDGSCGRTSLPFDPPLVIAAGDSVKVSLGYDLSVSVVSGPPHAYRTYSIAGRNDADGSPHSYRDCFDVSPDQRDCMDYPDLTPSASKM